MRCLIREELKKLQADRYVSYAIIGFALLCDLIVGALWKLDVTNEDVFALYGKNGLNLYFFIGINALVGLLCAMFVGYMILTKEYINDTWDLLMTKLFDGEKLVAAKFIVFMLYQGAYMLFSTALYIPIAKLLIQEDIDFRMFGSVLIIVFFINAFCYILQYCIQLYVKNFSIAVVTGLLFIYILGAVREIIHIVNYIGPVAGTYAFESGNVYNIKFLATAALLNVVMGTVLVYISGKKFYS
ncbi:ABC transporter permease [Butyrivibrio sp. M55]|uniref:ABC transporter permease n=1 Tax=Butyrivibrio sp. M55 TaxID=1855323 RepID=UPI0008E8DC8B|nr:ABC transporter permease [Butyrivibrio sp. M55]SFU72372.1 ABC-2 family transporter protein [Butyrivibrio sp. M55]